MRDDTRDPNGHYQGADDFNYYPAAEEIAAWRKEALDAGATPDEADDWVREMSRAPDIYGSST